MIASRRVRCALVILAALATVLGLGVAPALADSASFTPVADTWVNSNQPTQNNGSALRILANGSPEKYGLIQFDVSGIPAGATGVSGVLTLTSPTAQTAEAVQIHALANGWDESDTYNTAPRPGALLDSGTMPSSGSVSFDVPISGNGTVSFAVTKTAGGDSIAASRENAAKAPKLAVTWTAGGTTAAPTADYRYDPVSGPAPLTVSFDNISSGADSYLWDFGDGSTSTAAEPGTHTFADPGSYSVTLTATNAGGSDSITGTVTVDGTPPPPPPPSGGGPFISYEPGSYFNTPLPDNAPIDSQSAAGIAYAKASNSKDWPTVRGVDGNPWGMVYAMGQCSDPVWKFPSSANLPNTVSFLATQGFHAPASFGNQVSTASNGDQPIVVIDRCGVSAMPNGFTVWGANVDYNGNSGHVLQTAAGTGGNIVGGAFQNDSNGLDHRVAGADSNLNERSRGAIPDAMVVRDDLLSYGMTGGNNGTLGHVLHMFWNEPDSAAGHVLPMAGNEGGKTGWGPEGIRIRVKPSWTPPAGCTGAARVLARTFQDYGAYIGDTSGGNSGVKAEQGSNMLHVDSLQGCVTWDDMEFVQRGWTP